MTMNKHISGVEVDADYLLGLSKIISRTKGGRANLGSLSGNVAGRKRGRGSIFYDVRPWTEGDDIRHIDSYKTARTGFPHIRTSHEDREHKTLLIADFRPSMFFGTRRALRSYVAAEVISLTGWRAVSDRSQIGVLVITHMGSTFLGWSKNERQFAGQLIKLADIYRDAKGCCKLCDPEMDEVMAIAINTSGSASIIVATSLDAPGENFDKLIGIMAKRQQLIFLLISDKFERDPPPGVYPYLTRDGLSGCLKIMRDPSRKPINNWPMRLSRLGALSLGVDAELSPTEIAYDLDRFYDRPR